MQSSVSYMGIENTYVQANHIHIRLHTSGSTFEARVVEEEEGEQEEVAIEECWKDPGAGPGGLAKLCDVERAHLIVKFRIINK